MPLLALVAAALVLPACSSKSAPQTTAPPGFTAIRDAKNGFAIAVPADWVRIALTNNLDQFDKLARDLQTQHPAFGPAIIQARQLSQSRGKMMAVSPDGKSSVNVTADKTKEKTLAQIGTATTKSLTDSGATSLTQEQATTGAGPALKLSFKYPMLGSTDASTLADEVQFYVLHGGQSWVITVINGSADVVGGVAQSFKLS